MLILNMVCLTVALISHFGAGFSTVGEVDECQLQLRLAQ
jgi:hypothetical protein